MLWLTIVLILFIFQVATILLIEFRYPEKTVAWLLILFILPIIGFVMYYFVAKEYRQRKIVRRKGFRILDEMQRAIARNQDKLDTLSEAAGYEILQQPRLLGLLFNMPGAPITKHNEIEVLSNVEAAYAEMLEAIARAKHHVHFEFYTIRDDAVGRQFRDALVRKAGEGVRVRIIYDGIGSYKLTAGYVESLKQAGAEVHCFLPPLFAFFDKRLNYRNHRKIVVVDGKVGFLGGINIGDEYLGRDPHLGYWRDTHLRLEGDSVYYLQQTFLNDWEFVSRQKLSDPLLFPEHDCPEGKPVQILPSGPDVQFDAIFEMSFGAIAAARRRIWITTPYFIPDRSIMIGLKTAAVSGVDVRILLPGVPDSRIVYYATLSYIKELMQAGVKFYMYRKGFIHSKTFLVDGLLASAGTANMDMRSFFDNFEINAVFFDKKTIDRLERDFQQDMKDSDEIVMAQFEKRSRWQRGKEVLARLLSPLF
ncbi:cardiolipin synthase [Gordoniibacillus kamchatkensis]|uniref:Cardiolipin synthase n=1 Tax=Gordoniibacillus kamchatkensis TaxID=1590651 RepID=A0ABR5AET3_9BACL|nr:cardiolipin synthase [Paenibacillus sp. VKM B-2647]KIL39470.1 cardiolipin synthase [Paenibacillus sp. VKM B-2647]